MIVLEVAAGITGLILDQFENIVPLKPVLGGVGSVEPLHYCTCTDSIKPILQFSILGCFPCFHRTSSQNLFISTAAGAVPCGGRKTSTRPSS